jgi:hypothetical protein
MKCSLLVLTESSTSLAECLIVLISLYLPATRLQPTEVSIATLEHPISYTPETEECPESLDHNFWNSGASTDIYKLETQEHLVRTKWPIAHNEVSGQT